MTKSTPMFVIVGLALVAGCPMDYGVHNKGEVEDEECTALCNEQVNQVLDGCTIDPCGVDVASPSDPGAIVLAPTDNGSCVAVVTCPEGSCYDTYVQCAHDQGSDIACSDDYDDCVADEAHDADCVTDREQCEIDAEIAHEECLDDPAHQDDYCDYMYEECDLPTCECFEDACLEEEDEPSCDCPMVLLVLPPAQTGPQRWTVSRTFIDHQLGRLAALDAETGTWGVANAAGTVVGVRVASVDPEEALFLLGVRNDDVVVSINGDPIIPALQHPAQLLALRDTSLVTIGIRRAGVAKQLRYDLVP